MLLFKFVHHKNPKTCCVDAATADEARRKLKRRLTDYIYKRWVSAYIPEADVYYGLVQKFYSWACSVPLGLDRKAPHPSETDIANACDVLLKKRHELLSFQKIPEGWDEEEHKRNEDLYDLLDAHELPPATDGKSLNIWTCFCKSIKDFLMYDLKPTSYDIYYACERTVDAYVQSMDIYVVKV